MAVAFKSFNLIAPLITQAGPYPGSLSYRTDLSSVVLPVYLPYPRERKLSKKFYKITTWVIVILELCMTVESTTKNGCGEAVLLSTVSKFKN